MKAVFQIFDELYAFLNHHQSQYFHALNFVVSKSCFIEQVKTAQVSGGNCYNDGDDEVEYFEEDFSNKTIAEDFSRYCFSHLFNFFEPMGITQFDLQNYLDKASRQSVKNCLRSYVENEYYGNSTTYGIYGLDVEPLIKTLCNIEIQKEFEVWLKEKQSSSK